MFAYDSAGRINHYNVISTSDVISLAPMTSADAYISVLHVLRAVSAHFTQALNITFFNLPVVKNVLKVKLQTSFVTFT